MLIDLKVSSLACKHAFYRTNHNANVDPVELNFEGIKMQKRNIAMDRAQRADEKSGIVCLFIMFTPRVMVIKMS